MSDNQNNGISKLAEALAKAQGAMKTPNKNQEVNLEFSGGRSKKYKYADLAGVIDAVREPLSTNGLAYFHKMGNCETVFGMRTVLVHSSGEQIDTWYPLPDPTKCKAQDFGSAMTYARRYSLSSLLGIASDDDDDGQSANDINQGKQSKAQNNNQTQEPKKPDPQAKLDPLNFVMPFGDAGVKGTKLGALSEVTINNIDKYIDGEIEKSPQPKNIKTLLQISLNVKAMRKLWAEKNRAPTLATPENITPEAEKQSAPDYENQSQEPKKPDPADAVVGMSFETVEGVNGKKLREIPESSIKAMAKELDALMAKVPPPQNVASLFAFKSEITAFLKSAGA